MKSFLTRPTRFEWRSMAIIMPMTAAWLNYLLFGPGTSPGTTHWILSYPVVLLQCFAAMYVQVVIMHRLRDRFPCLQKAPLRWAILLVLHATVLSLSFATLLYGYAELNFPGYIAGRSQSTTALYTALVLTFIVTTMWEAEYAFRKWRDTLAEKEKLEQLRIEQEFETLKGQVNPHFLFNCFNTLSSLISEDRKQAEIFLDELSKVYRYLLKNNEDGLSTLETETRFIRSYYKLLQTRHGDAVELHISIDEKYQSYFLPSLSLQLLIENAVKHNILSKERPLVIHIFTAGNQLAVSNNLQLRTVKAPSNKIGLENIRAKYTLLKQQGFQVMKDERSFTVTLPLIKTKPGERSISYSNTSYESAYSGR